MERNLVPTEVFCFNLPCGMDIYDAERDLRSRQLLSVPFRPTTTRLCRTQDILLAIMAPLERDSRP